MIELIEDGYYIEAHYDDKASMWGYADENFIHLMRGDVKEEWKQKGIMTKLVETVMQMFPNAELSFHSLSCEGKNFVMRSFPDAKIRPFRDGKYIKITLPEYIELIKNPQNKVSKDNPCGC